MAAGQLDSKRVAAIIQARMGSTRLPGKITMPLPYGSKFPMLLWPVEALRKVRYIDQIILATSQEDVNTPLAVFARAHNIGFIAGSENDVLSRFAKGIETYKPDIIVRITGDNPILDSAVIDQVINFHIANNLDYTYSTGMPLGMNVEVANAEALVAINEKLLSAEDREHVTLYFKTNNDFRVSSFPIPGDEDFSNVRLTVDYPADYAALNLVAKISKETGHEGLDLVRYVSDHHPWIWEINNSLYQKKYYSSLAEEMKDAVHILQKYEMHAAKNVIQKLSDEESNFQS